MGATRNTGYLENIIAYDASNNVAIATSVNPSYKVTLGGSLSGTSATFSGDLTVATTALFLNSSNSRLGLGTITPSTRLHIVDSGNSFLTLQRTGVSAGSGQYNINIESNSQTTISYDSTTSYVIGTSTDPKTQAGFSQKFALSSAGAATFSNDIIVNGGGWIRPNNIYAFTADAGTTYIQQPSGGNMVFRKSDSTVFLNIANSGAATFSGNVGLGATSSYAKFNISTGNDNQMALGTTSTSQTVGIFLADGPTTSSTGYKWEFGKDASNNFFIYSYGTAGFPFVLNYSTGAATFSSSVTAINGILNNSGNNNTNALSITGTSSTAKGHIGQFSNSLYLSTNWYYDNAQLNDDATLGASAINLEANATAGTSAINFSLKDAGAGGVSPKMSIKSNGNVGIGTTSPTNFAGYTTLTVNGTSGGVVNTQYNGTDGLRIGSGTNSFITEPRNTYLGIEVNGSERMRITSGGTLQVKPGTTGGVEIGTSTTAFPTYLSIVNDGNTSGVVVAQARSAGHFLTSASAGDMIIGASTSQKILFGNTQTGTTEYMRITSGGNVLIGTTTDGGFKTYIVGTNGVLISAGSSSSNNSFFVQNQAENSTYFKIRGDGYIYAPQIYVNTTATAANVVVTSGGDLIRSTSSVKYKKNVVDYTKGLAEVMNLRPVNYQGKNEIDGNKVFAGLIAEEVHDAGLTEFVQYAEDGSPDALAYQNMIALLVKGMQEQQAQIEELKSKLA